MQLDFQMPGRFKCEYTASDGQAKIPVMIHAAVFGSFERMTGMLTEHFAGVFPIWLSPVQIKVLPVGEGHIEFSRNLVAKFEAEGLRVEIDESAETVGNKTRKAVNEKVPYILVVGDKEMGSDKLAVRERGSREAKDMDFAELVRMIKDSRPKI
jgi:threonyl-tRNA synthetase